MSRRDPLVGGPEVPARLLLSDVLALDPRSGIDGRLDVRVRDGVIAELGEAGTLAGEEGEELISGDGGRRLVPGFFDPHVHLRTPGQEHKEDLESGTRAAAAGGYCGLLAMPNTDPVLDSAPLLRSLRDSAARQARIPVAFLPAITRGLQGEQLTEMAELAEEGAPGFTDDGRPVASADRARRVQRDQPRIAADLAKLGERVEDGDCRSGEPAFHSDGATDIRVRRDGHRLVEFPLLRAELHRGEELGLGRELARHIALEPAENVRRDRRAERGEPGLVAVVFNRPSPEPPERKLVAEQSGHEPIEKLTTARPGCFPRAFP